MIWVGGVVVPRLVVQLSVPERAVPCSLPVQSDQYTMLLATIGWANPPLPPLSIQCSFSVAALAVVSPVSEP